MSPYLSIIIPAYQEEKNLPLLLKSIFSSSFQNFEVIIGDDASLTLLESLVGSKFSDKNNLKWVRLEKNQGPAAARNKAAKLAKGEVLVFFDADVILYPDTLEKIAIHFKKDRDLHALTGVWDKNQKNRRLFPQYKALRDWSYWINERDRGEYYYLFSTRCAAIKRAIFERLGGFNRNFRQMEDVELTYRIARRYAIIFCADVRVHHEFEGFWTIAKKYFWRSFYWSKLYSKRRKFDPVATTLWEMLTALYGVLSLPLIVLGIFSQLFLILGIACFLAHLFFLRKFLGFVFREKGLFFTFYSIAVGLGLYWFIAAGGVWAVVRGKIGVGNRGDRGNRGDPPLPRATARRCRGEEKRGWGDGLIALVIFALVFCVGSAISPDYGIVWDEPDNIFSGGVYFNFFTNGFDREYFKTNLQSSSFFGNKIFPLDRNLAHLPPFANILGSGLTYFLVYKIGILNEIICFHLASVFFLGLAAGFVFLFARLLGLSRLASIFTGFSLWLYPHFFGHGHSNIKDIAQASLFLVSLYFLTKAVLKNRLLWVFFGAVVFGLAFDTKFNAIYIPLIWNLWVILGLLGFRRNSYGKNTSKVAHTSKVKSSDTLEVKRFRSQNDTKCLSWRWWVKANLILILVGGITIYLFWPYLWDQPWLRIAEVIGYFTTVGKGYFFFFNGELYQAGMNRLWYYPWVYYLIVTPLLILGLGVIGVTRLCQGLWRGVVRGIREIREIRNPEADPPEADRYGARFGLALLFIWFLPLGRAFLARANLYDGVRHFLEVIPAIILLAGVGFEMIQKYIIRHGWLRVVLMVLVAAQLAWLNFSLHPFQTAYYNSLVGGTKGAQDRFDMDLEGLSAKEAMDILHQKEGRIKVYFPLVAHLAQYYLLAGDELVGNVSQAEFVVIINKKSHIGQPHFQEFIKNLDEDHELYEVIKRNGAEIARIYKLVKS